MKSQQTHSTFSHLALGTAVLAYLTIVLGGIVRSLGGEGTCPDWPACYGSYLLPAGPQALVDYAHRLGSLLLVPALIGLAVLAFRKGSEHRGFRVPVAGALLLVLVQGALGGWIALTDAPDRQLVSAVHLGLSLLVLALVVLAAVASVFRDREKPFIEIEPKSLPAKATIKALRHEGLLFSSRFSKLTLVTVGALFVLLVSGAVVSGSGAEQACTAWPLCGGGLVPQTAAQWANMEHRIVVLLAGGLMGYQLIRAWKTQRSQTAVLAASTAAAALFFAQALMGAYKVSQGFPAYMTALHEASAVAVWGALIVQVSAVGIARRSDEGEAVEEALSRGRKGLGRDFLMLTKPVVVLLLLVTTFTGMVIGAQAWPSISLVFWTLLGGAMAAGGSGAINQYIDRNDDVRMQRTSNRPIPAGRMMPAEGLAFGIALCIGSFFLLVAFVNLLAALLSLAGIIYYVLLYSIFLKKASVQNIVIGGGAGAIPPLVGWAAATGSLNIPSLFLFALIFMWTPPHFWALAIVRSREYARAGVPMLPVVRGEKEARKQILIYTVELVLLTLLLPLFGLGGSIYMISAAALGLWLLAAAVKVWRVEGNKVAWKMYRYSSMYLAFLFVALMVDRLVLK